MMKFQFPAVTLPPNAQQLREEVRAFLARELQSGGFTPALGAMVADNAAFSRKCGAQGWLGMTWPKQYGGHERSALERYVVVEELLAAGAPVMAHWIADRQSGPQILRHGSERAKKMILPEIAAGRCFFAIGMSEPDTGSDLASVRTRAMKTDGGYKVTGRKIWTSFAHKANYLIALVRTSGSPEQRHVGLTQLIIDMKTPGISIRPIFNIHGGHDFNEVTFDDVFVPEDMTVGGEGNGFNMGQHRLAYGRLRHGMNNIAKAQRALDMATARVTQRSTFGTLLADRQAVQFMLADCASELYIGRLMLLHIAYKAEKGLDIRQEN